MPRDFLSGDIDAKQNSSYQTVPRDFLQEQTPESKATSIELAIPRIGEDIIKGGYNTIKNIPQYLSAAQSSIPAALNTIQQNPRQALNQGIAGLAEFGQNVFNTPHDIANYATNRLNLIPQDINQKIQMARMPNSENEINATFGVPQNTGEEALRWGGRNIGSILGGLGAAKALNPLQLTDKGVAKKVVNELNNQVDMHSNMYNNLWKEADKKGFNQVPFDKNALKQDYRIIKRYYTPKQYKSIRDLLANPTLENAQTAQSDIGTLKRAIEEKSKSTPLLEGENNIHNVLSNAENNIEGNMFKDKNGILNDRLANRYKKITNSYRNNVVPYRYNSDIQDYLNKDITAKQLVQRLSQGPFAAKKGGFLTHPQFAIRNALLPTFGAAAGIGLYGGGKYLYDQATGNKETNQ